jgi:hypothetical protein
VLRTLIAALLASPLIAARAHGALGPLGMSQTGAATAQACRTAATASTTKSTSPGFTSQTSTTCRYDKATNKSTCTNKYKDSFKQKRRRSRSPPTQNSKTRSTKRRSIRPAGGRSEPTPRAKGRGENRDAAGRPTAGRSVVEERFRVQGSTFSVHFSTQNSELPNASRSCGSDAS